MSNVALVGQKAIFCMHDHQTIAVGEIALWDALLQDELDNDVLETVSDIALDSAGYYLLHPPGKQANAMTEAFADWIGRQIYS